LLKRRKEREEEEIRGFGVSLRWSYNAISSPRKSDYWKQYSSRAQKLLPLFCSVCSVSPKFLWYYPDSRNVACSQYHEDRLWGKRAQNFLGELFVQLLGRKAENHILER